MRKVLVAVFAVAVLTFCQRYGYAQESSVAYLNLSQIFNDYEKVGESNKNLDGHKDKVKVIIDELRELEKNLDQLSEKGRQERQNQIQAKQEEARNLTLDIRKDEDRILREILQDIEKAAGEIRQKKKLSYIIDDRLVISGPKEMDLTGDVVKLLNERYKPKK